MIIILTGPTGVGKTDTSWALLQQFDQLIFLDADWFASRTPFSWEKEEDIESVFQTLSLMIGYHLNKANKNFIIPIPLPMAKLFQKYKGTLSKWGLPICAIRLSCSEQELERRIKERDRTSWKKQEELRVMLEHQNTFDSLFPDGELFNLVDSTFLSEHEVAIKISEIAKET
jgi:adenylate kinase family enzyme